MALDLPHGTACFVDTNIFVYHLVELGEPSAKSRAFLGRVVRSEIEAATTSACLADAVHRVMAIEAQGQFGLGSGAVAWLQRHPQQITKLSAFLNAAGQLETLPLQMLTADNHLVREAAELSRRHGLLTNDATILALMQRHNLTHLVTNDDDFDAIPGLTIWKPR
jgi:predicted nucleic acid-binding protein